MNSVLWRVAPLFAAAALIQTAELQAQTPGALCIDGQCAPAISATTYRGREAFKLTDGTTEAIVVPQIGRIMSFGKVGGPNLLWNLSGPMPAKPGYINYGGDKTWLAPQSSWKAFHGKTNWPPDAALDGKPFQAEVLSGGKLRMTSSLSPSGIRLSKTMFFDSSGEFVIEQTVRKEKGAPVRASIWSVTQIVPGERIYVPQNSNSAYKEGYYKFPSLNQFPGIFPVTTSLLAITPRAPGKGVKFGFDAPVSSIVSMHNNVAFLQKSTRPAGEYPDGKAGAGFPVELYISENFKSPYCELELLGPLKTFSVGGKSTHTVRWSLHAMSSGWSPGRDQAIEKLLYGQ